MASQPNKVLRILVPIIAFVLLIPLIWGLGSQASKRASKATSQGNAPTLGTSPPAPPVVEEASDLTPGEGREANPGPQPTGEEGGVAKAAQPSAQPETPATTPAETQTTGMRVLSIERFAEVSPPARIVGDDSHPLSVEFSPVGAGVRTIELLPYKERVGSDQPVRVQFERYLIVSRDGESVGAGPGVERHYRPTLVPFSAALVTIDGQRLGLADVPPIDLPAGSPDSGYQDFTPAPMWRQVGDTAGVFEAFVLEGEGESARRIARIVREFRTRPGSFVLGLDQRVENLTDKPMSVSLTFFGPAELAKADDRNDQRKVRFGYLLSATSTDPMRDSLVLASDYHWLKGSGALKGAATDKIFPQVHRIWPNQTSESEGHRLAWAGVSDRYFGAAVYPGELVKSAGGDLAPQPLSSVEEIDRVLLAPGSDFTLTDLALRVTTESRGVPPASGGVPGSVTFPYDVYVGPLSERTIAADDSTRAMGLSGLIVYNMGGPCAPCTFSWLANILKSLLSFLHDTIVHDWALAIILLVVVVRTCLHPVTRWSQIRLQRFGKQMQGMAPKQRAIQEKYAGDRVKMQQEMTKLWREEGINPAGMLGCLPILLQTPVWIALYAMLYFDFDLRHSQAFFGVFQKLAPSWTFLGDLSAPDAVIPFGQSFSIPLISSILGNIGSFNILPLILGVVFFIQQKYLTPPTTTPQTPEQEMQMKMVKWMSVFMFPIFMYNQPAGLTLYFITNSTLGIFEVRYIRSHYKKLEDAGKFERKPGKPKREPKPGGFIDRLRKAAEAQRAATEAAGKQQSKVERRVQPGKKDPSDRKYKRRQ